MPFGILGVRAVGLRHKEAQCASHASLLKDAEVRYSKAKWRINIRKMIGVPFNAHHED